jgi:hypothetical protein
MIKIEGATGLSALWAVELLYFKKRCPVTVALQSRILTAVGLSSSLVKETAVAGFYIIFRTQHQMNTSL